MVPGNFPMGELTHPTRGLKYDFQGTIKAKNLRKNHFSPSDRGLACSDGGYSPIPPLTPPLIQRPQVKRDRWGPMQAKRAEDFEGLKNSFGKITICLLYDSCNNAYI